MWTLNSLRLLCAEPTWSVLVTRLESRGGHLGSRGAAQARQGRRAGQAHAPSLCPGPGPRAGRGLVLLGCGCRGVHTAGPSVACSVSGLTRGRWGPGHLGQSPPSRRRAPRERWLRRPSLGMWTAEEGQQQGLGTRSHWARPGGQARAPRPPPPSLLIPSPTCAVRPSWGGWRRGAAGKETCPGQQPQQPRRAFTGFHPA